MTLFAGIGYLVQQNISYTIKNRELLLQNDSIMSVNIRLANEVEKLRESTFSSPKGLNRVKSFKN